jgi:GNAT superfamily N-acetyltransferase
MWVRPQARRRGVGWLVLEALEAAAREGGARRVVLETGYAQHEAVALYLRAGYEPIPCWGAYADGPVSRCYAKVLSTHG